MEAPFDRIPVEIWQGILLLAIESDGSALFTTTRTPSTFIHFLKQEEYPDKSYTEYVKCRATLRQVCRAWNHFLLSTNSWWIHVDGLGDHQQSLDFPSITDPLPTIKRLSMTIPDYGCVRSSLDWAFDLLQRVQVPLLSYNLILYIPWDHGFVDEPINILAAFGPKAALRSLRIACVPCNACGACGAISLPQLNANFKDLVSLSLVNLVMHSTEELTLPHLEHLHLSRSSEDPPLPTQGWDLPRLRHVYIDIIRTTTYFNMVLDFLRRFGSQLESLFLIQYPHRNGLPHDFWDSFTALQLLGLSSHVLNDRGWSGWTITPPRTHPFRYLACREFPEFEKKVDSLRSMWTYHEDVALVMVDYLIEDIKEEGWRTRMTRVDGILPTCYPHRR